MSRLFTFRLLAVLTAIGGVTASLLGAVPVSAEVKSSASFSIASGTYTANDVFPISIYEDSGETEINAIGVELLYDPTKLELVKVESASNGQINAPGSPEHASGSITIGRLMQPSASNTGRILAAVIQFRALTSSGATVLTVGPGSEIYSMQTAENIWDGDSTSATITFAAAVSSPAATQSRQATYSRAKKPTVQVRSAAQVAADTTTEVSVQNSETNTDKLVTVSVIGTSASGTDPRQIAIAGIVIGTITTLLLVVFARQHKHVRTKRKHTRVKRKHH